MIKDFQTKEKRLRMKRLDNGTDFLLADDDDFFGFTTHEEVTRNNVRTITVILAIITIVLGLWAFFGYMQRECLERNMGNITLCE